MKILITGSGGHLGEALVRVLQPTHDVVGVDLKPSTYTTHVGDLVDQDFVRQVVGEDVDTIIHTATLHKPHIATHTKQAFVNTNVTATLHLLEAAVEAKVRSFVYTSTTSTYGDSLAASVDGPAVWVTEALPQLAKNIYGATKSAAEDLCRLFHRNHALPCLILKTSRFFPEEDDSEVLRQEYNQSNLKANELLHRRVDLQDAVDAHLLALEKAPTIGFAKYIISATTPFRPAHLEALAKDAPGVVRELYPHYFELYRERNWQLPQKITRVYVNTKAKTELGWQPKYDFEYVLGCLAKQEDLRSPLAIAVGCKGYHERTFDEGPYPVED